MAQPVLQSSAYGDPTRAPPAACGAFFIDYTCLWLFLQWYLLRYYETLTLSSIPFGH